MARVAEQAYRRGAQQGAGLAQRLSFRADLGEWRYQPSLDLSPWLDSPRMTTSLERLDGECGEALRRIGLSVKDTSSRGSWPITWRRPQWAGYTREQRCSIQALDRSIEDYAAFETHDAFVKRIRAKHGRKTGFWSRVAELTASP